MRGKSGSVERAAARFGSRQYGLVTRKQLRDAEVPRGVIDRKIEKGLLIPEHPGVYRVGHSAPSSESTYMAAVLAGGEQALLAGKAAGHLMKLLKGPPPDPEVIAITKKKINGAKTKRVRHIDRRDATQYRGIPCTTVPRTLVDLAADLSEDDLARAVHEASVRYRTTPQQIEAVLRRRPPIARARASSARFSEATPKSPSASSKNASSISSEEHGLELPETNERIGSRYIDCRWPERKLTVELDGYRYHATRHAWEQDRKREREARRRGDDFRRFTWGDVFEEPDELVRELRSILAL